MQQSLSSSSVDAEVHQAQIQQWLTHVVQQPFTLAPLAGDASFRCYIRVKLANKTYMLMDAPPDKENSQPFVDICNVFRQYGVNVPQIVAQDLQQGFILLEDFGDALLSQHLNAHSVDSLYTQAMLQLLELHTIPVSTVDYTFPLYDGGRLETELRLFDEWFLPKLLNIQLSADEQHMLENTYARIIQACLAQPQVIVHRDYHCRNLMVLPNKKELGVIDFQDAVVGPITYDLVSILRDAYVHWPVDHVKRWVAQFLEMSKQRGHLVNVSFEAFYADFNVMAVQRHLKILGIFVRLKERDGKSGYMQDLPLVLAYLLAELSEMPDYHAFYQWLMQRVCPAFLAAYPDRRSLFESLGVALV